MNQVCTRKSPKNFLLTGKDCTPQLAPGMFFTDKEGDFLYVSGYSIRKLLDKKPLISDSFSS